MVTPEYIAEMEYGIIGAMLRQPDGIGEAVSKMHADDFSLPETREMYGAIVALFLSDAPVEPLSLKAKLGEGHSEAVACALTYAIHDPDYYVDIIRELSKLRRMQVAGMAIASAPDLKTATDGLDKLNGLMIDRHDLQITSAAEAAREFFDAAAAKEKPEYLTWGFPQLNERLYAELGDFIVVGGFASAGKTLLSVQFAVEMAKKYRVGYFSLETLPSKLTARCMAHLAKVPLSKIKNRNFNEADWAAMADAASRLSALHLDFIAAQGMTVADIQAVTLSKRYEVIFVDYLQIVTSHEGRSLYEQVTAVSKGLHTLAGSKRIAVIALAQLSRPEKVKGKAAPPTMASFRESGQIEQDADVAMILYPSDPNDNRSARVLKIAKNKEGERGKIDLAFDGAIQTLTPTKGEQYSQLRRDIKAAGTLAERQITFHEITEDGDAPF